MSQTQNAVEVKKLRGRVINIAAPDTIIRIFALKRGEVADVFVRRIGDTIEDYYTVVQDVIFEIDRARATAVYWALVLAAISGRVVEEEVDVYYAEYGNLGLYYFDGHLVYAVNSLTHAVRDLGTPKDGIRYASEYFSGKTLEVVKALIEALPKK